jgi:hypothetical protein
MPSTKQRTELDEVRSSLVWAQGLLCVIAAGFAFRDFRETDVLGFVLDVLVLALYLPSTIRHYRKLP